MEWKLCYAHEADCHGREYPTPQALLAAGYDCISASVPGNFELDLMAAGREKDLFWSTDTLRAQAWEDVHVWYFTHFDAAPGQYLHFGGIDTVADIYLNGRLEKSVENMFLTYDLEAPLREKDNQLVVHIRPAVLEARRRPLPAGCSALTYNLESLYIRKAPHAYGWDIMPRIVSCGLWRPVELRTRKADAVEEVFLYTREAVPDADDPAFGCVELALHAQLRLADTSLAKYRCRLCLDDGQDTFAFEIQPRHNCLSEVYTLPRCRLWWPKNAGALHLYRATLQLWRDGQLCDEYRLATGLRTVELLRTEDCEGPEGGEFVFLVNGKKIFVLGTNWVPLDAFHSRDEARLPQALALLDDSGCNMIRCWGGNVYGSDSLYDFCDAHGILVWQDFAMACAVYPQEERFYALLRQEVAQLAKRLRNHPSLALWAGDNECDMAYVFWRGLLREPANYAVTRAVIPQVLEAHDFTRPYLPSSPYISRRALLTSTLRPGVLPEDHLWGPRDYFKGPYYTQNQAHFASETGYHGCPAPQSLQKFLPQAALWPILDDAGDPNADWLTHAACMEPQPGKPYSYRIPLMVSQVQTLFGQTGADLDTFARMSQISQAEAKKFFIERFRMGKWQRTGIIWWNLLDGWPQVSDAVVDYYYTKKLAYHFIRRSQQPVCLMLSEPDATGVYTLYGVNDLPAAARLRCTVRDVTADVLLHEETFLLPADAATPLCRLTAPDHHMLQFCWQAVGEKEAAHAAPQDGPDALPQGAPKGVAPKSAAPAGATPQAGLAACGSNHYYTALKDVNYADYLRDLARCGYDEWEGF